MYMDAWDDLTIRDACALLRAYGEWSANRDNLIRAAYAAGVSKATIHRLSGLARSTIDIITDGQGPRLRAELAAYADSVNPSPDGLAKIQDRIGRAAGSNPAARPPHTDPTRKDT